MTARRTMTSLAPRSLRLTAALGVVIGLLSAQSAAAGDPNRVGPTPTRVVGETPGKGAIPYSKWFAGDTTITQPTLNRTVLQAQALVGKTIPFWTGAITSPLDTRTYTVSMVGTDPTAATKTSTTVTYVPISVRVHFANGAVLDPTAPLACTSAGAPDVMSAAQRFYNSPLFVAAPISSNGQSLATGTGATGVQLINGFQRAAFWSQVKNTKYGVTLTPSTGNPILVDVSAPAGSATTTLGIRCGNSVKSVTVGMIDINAFDAMVRQIVARYATPTQLPIVLTHNVVETSGGQCCILGNHNAIPTTLGTQTYAAGAFVDSGIFNGVDDITIWSHELAEWMDDPFVQAAVAGGGQDDVTPAWGHIGQVSGCQNNLETGDPLSGSEYAVALNGFTYHFQDLAFIDWFYRTPARGTGGKFSFMGGLTTTQGVCR